MFSISFRLSLESFVPLHIYLPVLVSVLFLLSLVLCTYYSVVVYAHFLSYFCSFSVFYFLFIFCAMFLEKLVFLSQTCMSGNDSKSLLDLLGKVRNTWIASTQTDSCLLTPVLVCLLTPNPRVGVSPDS